MTCWPSAGRNPGTSRRGEVIDRRLAVPREPRFFSQTGMATLKRGVRPDHAAAEGPAAGSAGRLCRPEDGRRRCSTATAMPSCRRRARPGGAGWRRWIRTARSGAWRRRSMLCRPNSRTRCCGSMQQGELSGDGLGRHAVQDVLRAPGDPRHHPRLLRPSGRLERDRLRRSGQPARLCAHGARPARPVGAGRSRTRRREQTARRKNGRVG